MTQCSSKKEKCINCNEAHCAGSKECAKYQREEYIVQKQEEEKVTAIRAGQMLEKNEFIERPARPYTTNFDCKMDELIHKKLRHCCLRSVWSSTWEQNQKLLEQ